MRPSTHGLLLTCEFACRGAFSHAGFPILQIVGDVPFISFSAFQPFWARDACAGMFVLCLKKPQSNSNQMRPNLAPDVRFSVNTISDARPNVGVFNDVEAKMISVFRVPGSRVPDIEKPQPQPHPASPENLNLTATSTTTPKTSRSTWGLSSSSTDLFKNLNLKHGQQEPQPQPWTQKNLNLNHNL